MILSEQCNLGFKLAGGCGFKNDLNFNCKPTSFPCRSNKECVMYKCGLLHPLLLIEFNLMGK